MTFGGDALTRLCFSLHENKGVFALLLGSGLSRAASIPTGWEITLDLVRRVAIAEGVADQGDWALWYREAYGKDPNYSDLLARLASSRDERRAIIQGYIEPTDTEAAEGKKTPTKAHHAIAQLVRTGHVRVIVTTNFDRLLENALREAGVEPTVVSSGDSLLGAEPLTHARCYVVKLHGDYKDARILNTDQELSKYPKAYDQLLERIFDEHGLVVCGWSGAWDTALRAAFLRAPNRRYPLFWAAVHEPAAAARELIDHKRGTVLEIDSADAFFSAALQRVETLEQTRRQNPVSVDLLVGTAKRLLSKHEHRIELDDLVATEVGRVIAALEQNSSLKPQGAWREEEFRIRVATYEALTEPLARICGALGRWGSDSERPLVQEAIQALLDHAGQESGGLIVWLRLREYPAMLLFNFYALGLLRSDRLKQLHDLLRGPLHHKEKTKPAVELLLSTTWEGGDKDFWKHWEGFERRKTPFSDHMLTLCQNWSPSFLGAERSVDYLHDKLEGLGALAYMERDVEKTLSDQPDNPSRPKAWLPVGRIGWSGSFHRLSEELQRDQFAQRLLDAGFAHGSKSFLEIYRNSMSWFVARASW